MQPAKNFVLVLITAPDLITARALAQAALEARLAACVNLVPKLESHYWWQGKIESSSEVLLMMKTVKGSLSKLERLVLAKHPYDTPEIVALALNSGSERYLSWMEESLGGPASSLA